MTKTHKKVHETVNKLRTYIQNDGGDMELTSFDDENRIAKIKIKGACVDCAYVDTTFDQGVKQVLLAEVPELCDVIFE